MNVIIALLTGFALGSIPFGYIVGRLKKVNITEAGSRSTGATNVGRALGPKYFFLVLLLDVLKGAAAVGLCQFLGLPVIIGGLGAIAGHIFTPFLKFRGGKGVATSIGVLLSIFPVTFLIALAVWVVVYLITFYVSLASISFAAVLTVIYGVSAQNTLVNKVSVAIIAIMILLSHLPNIRRLIKGTEPKTYIWRKS